MDYLLKASIVIAIFFICYTLFLKRETFFSQNRWFLLIGIITAMTLPFVVIPIEITVEPIEQVFTYLPVETSIQGNQQPSVESTIEWQDVIAWVYGIGLIYFLIRFILQFGSLAALLLKNPKLKDGFYTYVIVENKISPFSFFKWIVYNPTLMDSEEVELMLAHEKVHVNQLHSIDIVVSQLVCCIFWFNPIIWFYRNDIRQNLEYIADRTANQLSSNSKLYQKLLLKTSVPNQNVVLTNNFYNSLIKERIVMLQKSRSKSHKKWRSLLVLPLISIMLLSMNTKEIYTELPSKNLSTASKEALSSVIEIIIKNSASDAELDNIKNELKSEGIDMKIKTIKRNSEGLITAINVDFKTANGSANYSISNDKGIEDFYFKQSEDGSFAVGTVEKTTIIVEGHPNYIEKSKERIIVNGKEIKIEDNKSEFIIKGDSTNVKIVNGNIILSGSKDSTIRIKGDSLSPNLKWTNKNNSTYGIGSSSDSISLKEHVVIGYKSNESETQTTLIERPTVVTDTVYTEVVGAEIYIPNPSPDKMEVLKIVFKNGKDPLTILNGKIINYENIEDINHNKIKSITVLKGDKANTISKYGDDGKNGVIIIETGSHSVKGSNEKGKSSLEPITVIGRKAATKEDGNSVAFDNLNQKLKSPDYRTEVNNLVFMDDDNPRKNASLAFITKYTSDSMMEKNKQLLENLGISVKYSKIRRNKKGEITRIKVSLTDGKGSESSASWRNDDGIDGIEYGLWEGQLVARTSTMNTIKEE